MKLYGSDQRELITVTRIEPQDRGLIIKGKVFGTMPLSATLTPAELRQGVKLLGARGILFLLRMLLRRSPSR